MSRGAQRAGACAEASAGALARTQYIRRRSGQSGFLTFLGAIPTRHEELHPSPF